MSETVAGPRLALEMAGRPIAQAIKSELAAEVAAFVAAEGYAPILAMALLGDDKPSRAYSRRIARTCDEVGFATARSSWPTTSTRRRCARRCST